MNFRIYYKYLSSRIVSKWTVLFIDVLIVLISMLLAYALQLDIASGMHKISLYAWMISFSVFSNIIFFHIFRTYVGVIRFSSFVDIYRVFICLTFSYSLLALCNYCWAFAGLGEMLPNSVLFVAYLLNFSLMICMRISVKMIYEILLFDNRHSVNVFIYGFQGTGVNIAKSLRVSRHNHYRLRGFISDEPGMIGKHTMGCRVYANDCCLFERLKKKKVHTIIVSSDKLVDLETSDMVEKLLAHGVHVMTVPPLTDCLDDGEIKDIHIKNWLRRESVHIDIRKIATHIEGCKILVTGAAGAVGTEIVRELAALNPYQLILVDQAESPLYDVQLELSDNWKNLDVRVLVADVANSTRMEAIFKEYTPRFVFHAAAYKHVSLMEDYVSEAVQTNVLGAMNLANLALKYNVSRFIMISTNDAERPVHAMGCSKRLAEMYVQALAQRIEQEDQSYTKLMIVRFGDVYPVVRGCLMTLPEACQLILEAASMGRGGEVYVLEESDTIEIEPSSHEKIWKKVATVYDYEQVKAKLLSLIETSYAEKKEVIDEEMKKISLI